MKKGGHSTLISSGPTEDSSESECSWGSHTKTLIAKFLKLLLSSLRGLKLTKMVKQFANGPFTNRPFGFHIYTDSECLESVQKTVTVVGFALFVHRCGFGTYLQNLYFYLPTSFRDDCLPLYHCFKTYTLQ